MKIRRVDGGFDGGVPIVTLSGYLPQSRAARSFDVQLIGAANFPAERTVVIRLKVVERQGDAFLEARPSPLQMGKPREFNTRIRLAQLAGRDLRGYRIDVRDADD